MQRLTSVIRHLLAAIGLVALIGCTAALVVAARLTAPVEDDK